MGTPVKDFLTWVNRNGHTHPELELHHFVCLVLGWMESGGEQSVGLHSLVPLPDYGCDVTYALRFLLLGISCCDEL